MFDKKSPFFKGLTGDSAPSEKKDTDAELDAYARGAHERLREDQVTFRLKSVAGIGFLLLFLYGGYVTFFDSHAHARRHENLALAAESFENRYPEERKASAGFFQKIFCKGLQRSSFCPSTDPD